MDELLAIDDGYARNQAATIASNLDNTLEAPWYRGAGTALVKGIASGAAKNVLLGTAGPNLAPGDPLRGFAFQDLESNLTPEAAQAETEAAQQTLVRGIQSLAPDARTTGLAGRIMFGFGDILPTAVAATATGGVLAAFPTIAAQQGYAGFEIGKAEGMDVTTAAGKGVIEGLTTGAGVALPGAIGGSLLRNILLTGPAINAAQGIVQRGAMSAWLEHNGYVEQAQQYQAFDKESLAVDVVLGAAFGGLGALGNRPMNASQIDAALSARNAQHIEQGTAPGVPTTPAAQQAHSAAIDTAIQQLMRGERVSVADAITEAEFLRPALPQKPLASAVRELYRDQLPTTFRFEPSERLSALPVEQRRVLRYDAPELNDYAASVEQRYGLPPGLLNAIKNAGEKSNSDQVSPAGARGVMQFMPENLKKFAVKDATDPVEMIDAAGRYLQRTLAQYNGDVRAAIADYNGGPKQGKRVQAGERPAAKETDAYLARVESYLGGSLREMQPRDVTPALGRGLREQIDQLETRRAELVTESSRLADTGEIAAAREELAQLEASPVEATDTGIRDLAKSLQSTSRMSYKAALAEANRQMPGLVEDYQARVTRVREQIETNASAQQAVERLAEVDRHLAELRSQVETLTVPAAPPSFARAAGEMAAIREAPLAVRSEILRVGRVEPIVIPGDRGAEPVAQPGKATTPAERPAKVAATATKPAAAAAETAGGKVESEQATKTAQPRPADPTVQSARVALEQMGDLRIPTGEMDADGNPVTLSAKELLDRMAEDTRAAEEQAPAYQAAVTCFLQFGE